jgi:hypothetical protein
MSRSSILALASIGVPAAVVRQAQATALLGRGQSDRGRRQGESHLQSNGRWPVPSAVRSRRSWNAGKRVRRASFTSPISAKVRLSHQTGARHVPKKYHEIFDISFRVSCPFRQRAGRYGLHQRRMLHLRGVFRLRQRKLLLQWGAPQWRKHSSPARAMRRPTDRHSRQWRRHGRDRRRSGCVRLRVGRFGRLRQCSRFRPDEAAQWIGRKRPFDRLRQSSLDHSTVNGAATVSDSVLSQSIVSGSAKVSRSQVVGSTLHGRPVVTNSIVTGSVVNGNAAVVAAGSKAQY